MATRRLISRKSVLPKRTVIILGGAAGSFAKDDNPVLKGQRVADVNSDSSVVRTGAGLLDEIRLMNSQTSEVDLPHDDDKLNA